MADFIFYVSLDSYFDFHFIFGSFWAFLVLMWLVFGLMFGPKLCKGLPNVRFVNIAQILLYHTFSLLFGGVGFPAIT